jgi:putative peptidoglycan lipid II flippase
VSASQTLARAGLIVTVAFLISRILGYVRVVVIGTTFGITGELDTFFAAFRIPDLIFQLVAAGALSSALIPIVSGLLATGEEPRAWRVVSTVANLVLAVLLVLAIIVFIAAPVLVPIITPGFDGQQLEKTIELTRIMLLSPIFLALGAIATSALNARGRFAASAIAPIVYNVGIIVGAVGLAPFMGVDGLAVGVVLGSVAHLLVQLRPLARIGFDFSPSIDLAEPLARRALVLMAPRALGMGASQITFVAMTAFASTLAPGSVSAFNIAMTLLQIPLGVIGVPLGIVILPTLSRELASGAVGRYLGLISRALGLLLFVMLPIAALGMVLRQDVVTLLFGYGQFTPEAVVLTADTLLVFLIGLAAHALIAVLARAFYAAQDTVTPVAAAIIAVVVNVSVGWLTVATFGLQGLAFAIAAGAWIEAGILVVILRRRYPAVELGPVALTFARAALGSAVAAALALAVLAGADAAVGADPGLPLVLVRTVLAALVGGVGYLAMSSVLRVPELPALIAVVTESVRRPGRA